MPSNRYRDRQSKISPESLRMRQMPLIDYMAWMLEEGKYDVDPETGIVRNVRTGRPLKARIDKEGYPSVNLAFDGTTTRPVRVHRLIAVKLWGSDAARDQHTAHLDGEKHRSIEGNLLLKTPSDHLKYDYAIGVRKPYRRTKTQWPPCARCGDPDGKTARDSTTPFRSTGRMFGIDGQLCYRCHKILASRAYREKRGAIPRQNARKS